MGLLGRKLPSGEDYKGRRCLLIGRAFQGVIDGFTERRAIDARGALRIHSTRWKTRQIQQENTQWKRRQIQQENREELTSFRAAQESLAPGRISAWKETRRAGPNSRRDHPGSVAKAEANDRMRTTRCATCLNQLSLKFPGGQAPIQSCI